MGLIDFLFRMLGLKRESRGELPTSVPTKPRPAAKTQTKTSYPRLHPLRFKRERWSKVKKSSQKLSASTRPFSVPDAKTERPYPLANQDVRYGGYLDLSQDLDELFEISDAISVMHNGELSKPIAIADATFEKIGLLMGGAEPGHVDHQEEVA